MGIKVQISAAQTACRQVQNPYFKSEVAGADRRSLYFISGRRKAVTFFFSASVPEMGKLS